MTKEITISVNKYVKKFLLSEPDYELLGPDTILAPQKSELGKLIICMSRMIPHTQTFPKAEATKNTDVLTIRYHCKRKAFDVPVERYTDLAALLNEQFRASLIAEVTALHSIHSEQDYSWMVRNFLERRNVITSDESDKDIDWDTAKKIYRDHLQRIDTKNSKKRRLSATVLSGFQPSCRV